MLYHGGTYVFARWNGVSVCLAIPSQCKFIQLNTLLPTKGHTSHPTPLAEIPHLPPGSSPLSIPLPAARGPPHCVGNASPFGEHDAASKTPLNFLKLPDCLVTGDWSGVVRPVFLNLFYKSNLSC